LVYRTVLVRQDIRLVNRHSRANWHFRSVLRYDPYDARGSQFLRVAWQLGMVYPGAMTRIASVRRAGLYATLAAAALLALAPPAVANVALTRVSADPFGNATSQHATEVEPDTFAFGSTVLAAYQVGRFFDGGSSDIGYARSTDGGATWGVSSFLPGLTFNAGPFADPNSPYERVSDPRWPMTPSTAPG
jgi:hypothetical protein